MFEVLGTKEVSSEYLLKNFLPTFENLRKQVLFEKALKYHKNTVPCEITINRVRFESKNSDSIEYQDTEITLTESFFEYWKDCNTAERKVWWMNFADPELFGYYDSSLFAQDEIQVFEHPLLASVRNYLRSIGDRKLEPRTVRDNLGLDEPTPFLIENVPLWNTVNTMPEMMDGSFGNLYGNNFFRASNAVIEEGIHVCTSDVKDNILAIAAPSGYGKYKVEEIKQIFDTLLSSFSAAKEFSGNKKCVIHGGNWGCGAFGGNRELMYFAQIFAASATGVDELVLHGIDGSSYEKAKNLFVSIKSYHSYSQIIDFILERGFIWGQGDGN